MIDAYVLYGTGADAATDLNGVKLFGIVESARGVDREVANRDISSPWIQRDDPQICQPLISDYLQHCARPRALQFDVRRVNGQRRKAVVAARGSTCERPSPGTQTDSTAAARSG